MPIQVLRQYYSFDVINSLTYEMTLNITMKVTDSQPYILLPVEGYLPDLKISDMDEKNMIVLSDKEFEKEFGQSMKSITDYFLKDVRNKLGYKAKKYTNGYRVIAVLFNYKEGYTEYYEKIKVSWIKRSKIKHCGRISRHSEIKFDLPRYGFEHGATSATYLSIKTNDKYKILESPRIVDLTTNHPPDMIQVFEGARHMTFRFKETNKVQFIHVILKIGLPDVVRNWASFGLISAVILPTIVLGLSIGNFSFKFGFELIAGVIALLLGSRFLIFQDIALMKQWSNVNLILVVYCIGVMVVLILLSTSANLPNV